MAAKTLGAKGTRTHQTPRGTNSSVRSNRMSAHQTPSRSAPAVRAKGMSGTSYRQGTFSGGALATGKLKVKSTQTGKTVAKIRVTTRVQGSNVFRAPKSMPSKLNNTAAAAVSARRYKSAGVGWQGPIGGALIGTGINRNRSNNNATLRLKAAGYKVGGTGFKGIVKPASPRAQQRAKSALARKSARQTRKGTTKSYISGGAKMANGRKANVTITTKSTRAGRKEMAAKKGNGGRRNVRVRRDGRGRFNGSY
jgi:hypothetical protein